MTHTQTCDQVIKGPSQEAGLTLGVTWLSQSSGTQDPAFPSLKVKIVGARKKWRLWAREIIIALMETVITTKINIDLRTEYDLTGSFEPGAEITIVDGDSYQALIAILTPEQRAQIWDRVNAGEFHAVRGFVEAKI